MPSPQVLAPAPACVPRALKRSRIKAKAPRPPPSTNSSSLFGFCVHLHLLVDYEQEEKSLEAKAAQHSRIADACIPHHSCLMCGVCVCVCVCVCVWRLHMQHHIFLLCITAHGNEAKVLHLLNNRHARDCGCGLVVHTNSCSTKREAGGQEKRKGDV